MKNTFLSPSFTVQANSNSPKIWIIHFKIVKKCTWRLNEFIIIQGALKIIKDDMGQPIVIENKRIRIENAKS